MAIYLVRVSEREYQVDVSGDQVRVNGQAMRARLTPINQNGHFLLQTGSDQREVHIRGNGHDGFMATIASRYFNIQVERNLRHRGKTMASHQGELKAPMPARVIDVRVQPGDRVTAGQTVVLLESMKMQMEIKAPFNGVIESIKVKAATQVEKGSQLLVVLPAAN